MFAAYCRKYYESGYQPIPILPNTKDAFLGGAQSHKHWSENRIPEKMIDAWEARFPNHNIAIVLGSAGKLMCLDIDCEDPELLKLIPPTPVIRKGRPGRAGAFFYKHSKNIHNRNFKDVLEFLTRGRYIMAPPSIHPDTNKPFEWAGPETLLSVDPEYLPEISTEEMEAIIKCCEKIVTRNKSFADESGKTEGRNNALRAQVTAAFHKGKSEFEVFEEIYEYDQRNHRPPLFSDPTENTRASTEDDFKKNAMRFVKSNFKTQFGLGPQELPNHDDAIEISFAEDLFEEKMEESRYKTIERPPEGAIKMMAEEMDGINFVVNPNLHLGAAFINASALCAGRFKTQFDSPSLYAMLIAGSSSGKDVAIKSSSIIFKQDEEMRKFNLYGPSDFSSAVASFKNFPWKRYQVCALDEASSFMRKCTNSNTALPDVIKIIIELWSIGDSYFDLPEAIYRAKYITGCYGPIMNLIIAIQKSMFIESQTKDLLSSGFFSRCLFFMGNDHPELNIGPKVGLRDLPETRAFANSIYKTHPLTGGRVGPLEEIAVSLKDSLGSPRVVPHTEGALRLRETLRKHYHSKIAGLKEGAKRVLYSKALEQIGRTSLVQCVMRHPADAINDCINGRSSIFLDTKDLEYCKAMVEDTIETSASAVEESVSMISEKIFVRLKEYKKTKANVPLSRLIDWLPGSTEQGLRAIDVAQKIGLVSKSLGKNGQGVLIDFL